MASIGSNQTSPYQSHPSILSQPLSDRILRALRHRLRLLHRPNAATFHILGATCNVYTVTLMATPTCTCPDRKKPCKHILFVLIRVLGVPLDDKCLRQRRLRPCLLFRLFSAPIRPDCLASLRLQELFLQLFEATTSQARDSTNASSSTGKIETEVDEEPATCPICLDDINTKNDESQEIKKIAVAKCRVCKNKVHEECMLAWRKSRGRRPAICVVCRARWRANSSSKNPTNVGSGGNYENCHGNCYLNLAPYVNGEEVDDGVGTSQRLY